MNRYEKVFRSSPSPMALLDLSGGVIAEVNQAFVDLTGFSAPEAVGRSAVELGLLTPEARELILEQVTRDGRFRFLEVTVGSKSGPIPALVSGEVVELDGRPHVVFVGADIRKRKAVEDLLSFTQFSVDQAATQILWASPDGRIIYANDLACEVLGYERDEILSLRVHDIDEDLSANSWPTVWGKVKESGAIRLLTNHRRKDAVIYPVEVSAKHLEAGGREVVVAFVRDLRDLQRIRKALDETETKFRTIFDQGVELMAVLDPDGTLLDANDAALGMAGVSRDQVVGKRFWDTPWWSHSATLQQELKGWIGRAGEGEMVRLEARHPDAEGGWRTVEASIVPIRGAQGGPQYLLAVGHDVTDRVRAAAALEKSEERYEALVANIPDVTRIFDAQGRTTFVSPNVEEVLGFSAEELLAPGAVWWPSRMRPDEAETMASGLEGLFARGEAFDLEYRFLRKDGRWIWLRDRAVRTFVEEGRRFAYGIVSDITDRLSLEVQLLQAQKLDTLGTLASGIAHDFNNILVPLLGYADLLRAGVGSEDPLRKGLETHVFDAVERARELVRQILTFSRKEEPERKAIHPSGPLKTALRLVTATIPAAITLRQRLSDDVGKVLGDGSQLQQVLLNLCTNAVHAMREEGGVLEVVLERRHLDPSLRARHPDFPGEEAAVVQVRDTGEGMEPGLLERAFDPFFTTKKVGEGTGLGLSIVYGIVKGHEGFIEGESRPGEGTTFTVFLPLAEGPGDDLPAGGLDEARGTESVLFIDDQEAVRETGRRLLTALGYETTLAKGGREALDLFRERPGGFDVVVSDYDMPGMTGTHLALELLEIRPDLPIVLITGSHPSRVMEGVGLGVRGSLMKPFTAGELGRAVRRALAHRKEAGEEG